MRVKGLPSVRETAYPRLKSSYSQKEVNEIYTPTPEELRWAKQNTRGNVAHLGLLVLLKISQRLGYFVLLAEIPEAIVQYIAQSAGIPLLPADGWNKYHASGTHTRHRALVRDYLGMRFFDGNARQIMVNADADSDSVAQDNRSRRFRKETAKFVTGVTMVLVETDQGVHGMTANAFMSVSLNPLTMAVSFDNPVPAERQPFGKPIGYMGLFP